VETVSLLWERASSKRPSIFGIDLLPAVKVMAGFN
jgi:hypothetical protein